MTETSWPGSRALLCAGILALLAFGGFSWKNDFSYYYHTDEPSKVAQITSGTRKFNHPLLLITATDLLARARGDLSSPQSVAIDGRLISAAASALAVGVMTLLAAYLFGLGAGVLTGLLLATHPLLFELSHYLKEDCCLFLGLACFFATLAIYERRRTVPAAMLLGGACGLAASGKYIGIIALIVAIPTLLVFARSLPAFQKGKQAAMLLAGFALVFLAVNFQAIEQPSRILQGLQREESTMDKHEKRQEERGKTNWMRAFEDRVIRNIPEVGSIPLLAFAVIGIGYTLKHRQNSQARVLCPILIFLGIYLVAISFSPLNKTRYLLPLVLLLCLCAPAGLTALRPWFARGGKLVAAVAATFVIILLLFPNISTTHKLALEFSSDSHRNLMEWIDQYVPPGSVFAVEQRSHLQELWRDEKSASKVPVVFRNDDIIGKPGVKEAIAANHVAYIILTEDAYADAAERAVKHEADRQIFEQFLSPSHLAWQSPETALRYLHPGLRLYRVTPAE